ncbi:hypothetical protein Tco_0942329 [Tanacetum coccineum]
MGGIFYVPTVDNLVTCRNLLDHVTPPGYWAMLRNQHDAGFLDSFNINSAQHRDAEVAELKAKLEKSESEATEVEELRKGVFDLEAMFSIKVGEAASLTAQNIREEFLSHQDATKRCFAELDARNADVRRDMDNDLYPHMLTVITGWRWVVGHSFRLAVHKCARSLECRSALGKVISMAINKGIQEGLEAGVGHGRAGRSLTQIEAYDPEVKGKYVATVSEFKCVSFPLFDEL